MPKFRVTASETCFYRGTVKAESEEALREMCIGEMDLVEYDNEEMDFMSIEEIKDDSTVPNP